MSWREQARKYLCTALSYNIAVKIRKGDTSGLEKLLRDLLYYDCIPHDMRNDVIELANKVNILKPDELQKKYNEIMNKIIVKYYLNI